MDVWQTQCESIEKDGIGVLWHKTSESYLCLSSQKINDRVQSQLVGQSGANGEGP
jgi:hypothetical protein